tara:strand:- start:19524 stop:21233 length:1710 start_codon:yes stop_codon:yes gene_type:complete
MGHIFKFLKLIYPKFKIKFLLFLIFTLLAITFETLSLASLIPALNILVTDSGSLFQGKTDFILEVFSKIKILSYEYLLISVIFGIFILKNLFLIFNQIWQNIFTLNIERHIASRLFKNYLNKEMTFHLATHSGTLIRNMSVEIKNISKSLSALFVMVVEITVLLTLIGILLYISPFVTIVSFLIIGFSGLFIIIITSNRISFLSKNRANIDKQYNKNLVDTFNTINDIKLMNKSLFFHQLHDFLKNKYFNNSKNFAVINSFPRQLMEIIIITVIISFIIYSIKSNTSFSTAITTLGFFSVVCLRLLPAISRIIVSFQSLKFRSVSFKIIFNELTTFDSKEIFVTNKSKTKSSNLFSNHISFKDVSFKYGEKKIFDSFNFKLTKNKFLFIYGESGAGKTTFLNLFMGLIKPSSGKIVIDENQNLHDNLEEWRNIVSYVPQQIYLLDENLSKNIAFGETIEEFKKDDLMNAIKFAKLDKFIDENNLLNFQVGEKGSRISGGQLQRIGVARALYRKPKILLLDESTNGLDYETERKFLEDLKELKSELTIIFVSHREHIKNYADEFIEIKKN